MEVITNNLSELMNLSKLINLSELISEAVNETNRLLGNPPHPVEPHQIHIVSKLPTGMKKRDPIRWKEDGNIYIHESLVYQIAKSQKDKGADDMEVRKAVVNLLKSVIARFYYIVCLGYREWMHHKTSSQANVLEVSRLREDLNNRAESLNLTFHDHHLAVIDETIKKHRTVITSYIIVILSAKYGSQPVKELERRLPRLAEMSVPHTWPSQEEFASFVKNKNVPYLIREGSLSLERLFERSKHNIFSIIPFKYFLVNGYRFVYVPESLISTGIKLYPPPSKVSGNIYDIQKIRPSYQIHQLRQEISKFNKLIDANFAGLELMFSNSETLTPRITEAILEHLEMMVDLYAVISDEDDDAAAINQKFIKMKSEFKDMLSAYSPNEVLPEKIRHSITHLDSSEALANVKTINEMFNYVHIRSFSALDNIVTRLGKDYFFLLKDDLKVIDANERPWIDSYGLVVNSLMRSILSWAEEETEGRIVLVDNCMWAHIKMGDHSAVINVHPFPPDEGGVLAIAYAEGIYNEYPQGRAFRVEMVKGILEGLGMRVSIRGENEFIRAILDKDSGIKTSNDILAAFHIAMTALISTRNIDMAIENLPLSDNERSALAHEWADIFAAENDLPFKVPNKLASLFVYGVYTPGVVSEEPDYEKYLEYNKQRQADSPLLRKVLNAELSRLNLSQLPKEKHIIGQHVIDTYLNEPVMLGIERKEFIMVGNRAERNEDYMSRRNLFKYLSLEPAKVLFVCTANTCRSNMAEQIMKHFLKRYGKRNIQVSSRGILVQQIRIRPVVYKSLSALGIPPPKERHIPTLISYQDVREADIIFVMTEGHREFILDRFPEADPKVFLLTEFSDSEPDKKPRNILDPSGQPDEAYFEVSKELFEHISKIVERFEKMDIEGLQTGTMVRQLEGHVRFETIGGMGRYLVQRAHMQIGLDMLDIYGLRDIDTNIIRYASVFDVKLADNGYQRTRLEPLKLYRTLEKAYYQIAPPLNVTQAQRVMAREKLYGKPNSYIAGEWVRGLGSSSGNGKPVSGIVTYQRGHTKKQGKIFIAPFTTPDDLKAIKEAQAVVTTGGGVLSHAGITTREFKIPSVILYSAYWEGKDTDRHIVLDLAIPQNYAKTPEGIWLSTEVNTKTIHVREEDILTVDGSTGIVKPFDRELQDEVKTAYRLIKAHDKDHEVNVKLAELIKNTRQFKVIRFVVNRLFLDYSEKSKIDFGPVLEAIRSNTSLSDEWAQYQKDIIGLQVEKADRIVVNYNESVIPCQRTPRIKAYARATEKKLRHLKNLENIFVKPSKPFPDIAAVIGMAEKKIGYLKKNSLAAANDLFSRLDKLTINDVIEIRRAVTMAKENDIPCEPLIEKLKELEAKKQKLISEEYYHNCIIPLSHLDDDYVKFVGGKNAKLGMLLKAKNSKSGDKLSKSLKKSGFEFAVPNGFAITTMAYIDFLHQKGILKTINDIAVSKELPPADRSRKIQKLIRDNMLTSDDELGRCIMEAFKNYMTGTGKHWFAVRSSAVQEDTQGLAYAGMGKTNLFVNQDALLEKIVDVEASVWTERAIIYYEENGIHPLDIRQAVVVQEMVDSEISGIIFTQNPVTYNNSQVVINASYGLGEAIVSGLVLGDQYITDKGTEEEISELFIGTKRIKIVKNPKGPGTKTEYVDIRLRNARALSVEQTKVLTRISRFLEVFFGYLVDIEFGIQGNTIWIIQLRPITTDIEVDTESLDLGDVN